MSPGQTCRSCRSDDVWSTPQMVLDKSFPPGVGMLANKSLQVLSISGNNLFQHQFIRV